MHAPRSFLRTAAVLCLALAVAGLAADRPPTSNPAPSTAPFTGPSTAPASRPTVTTQPYRWRQINDAAGGICTGIYFSSGDASIRYLTGDGGYSWDYDNQRWVSFTDWNKDSAFGFVTGLVLDSQDRNLIYYAAGRYTEIFKSTNGGMTFAPSQLQQKGARVTNLADSAAAERLVVDPNNRNILYFASQYNGLWCSQKASAPASWQQIDSLLARGDVEATTDAAGHVTRSPPANGGLAFIVIDRRAGTIEIDGVRRSRNLYVGVVGDRRTQAASGAPVIAVPESGLWRSTDGGQTWAHLAGPLRADNSPDRAYASADGIIWASISGRIVKATRESDRVIDAGLPAGKTGFYAMAIDRLDSTHLIVARRGIATAEQLYGEENRLYRSLDAGKTWKELKAEFVAPPWWGKFATRTNALRFEPNSPKDAEGNSKTLWLCDAIGPWVCNDLDADVTHWRLISRGRGGQSVSAIACPPMPATRPAGSPAIAPLLTSAETLCGFRYLSTTAAPDRSFQQPRPTRLDITSGIEFCETDPRFCAICDWLHDNKTAAGALSRDNGITWTMIESPPPGNMSRSAALVVGSKLQEAGMPILVRLGPGGLPAASFDWGKSWIAGRGVHRDQERFGVAPNRRLAADPLDGRTFYLLAPPVDVREPFSFSPNTTPEPRGQLLLLSSNDGGVTWNRVGDAPLSVTNRARYQLRACPGRSNDLWLSAAGSDAEKGLFCAVDGGKSWIRLAGWNEARGFAFGAPAPDRTNPSLVVAGVLNGQLGIYVSDDATSLQGDLAEAHWRRIWDLSAPDSLSLRFGLDCIGADRQSYGRIFVGSSEAPRGLSYGEPITNAPPAAPTNVSATAGPRQITIEWTDPIGAADYDVQRAPADKPAEWQTIATAAWQARLVDTAAAPGVKYVYRAQASNAMGRSDPSAATNAVAAGVPATQPSR